MCGIVGYFSSNPHAHVYQQLVDALTLLQHRGQDAAGICTAQKENKRLNLVKDNGTVSEVFNQDNITRLRGIQISQ